jgi:hypothetical protein
VSGPTPGPWTVGYTSGSNYTAEVVGESARGKRIVLARLPKPPRGTVEANATLMAAAPDLLEALRWYVEHDEVNFGQEGNEPYEAGYRRAEAAIAKATGAAPCRRRTRSGSPSGMRGRRMRAW